MVAELPLALERERLLDAETSAALAGMSKRSWFRYVSAGQAPQPIRLSSRIVRWKAGAVIDWLNSKNGGAQ